MSAAPPAGYVRVTVGRCAAVVLAELEADARALLADGTLYEAAARDLAARPLMGRGTAYAIALPRSGVRVVVRHNRHGGLLAPITRDLFFPPTRAPRELQTALRLGERGVRSPQVVMYGTAPALLAFQRADVVTREVAGGRDLSTFLSAAVSSGERAAAWVATRTLLAEMAAAGVRHHDLNVKNVLLAPGRETFDAWLLDVDRVVLGEPGARAIHTGNLTRLQRSARKWRDEQGAVFDERELAPLAGDGDVAA